MKMYPRGLVAVVIVLLLKLCCVANSNMVLPVERKFKGPITSLGAIKDHDDRRRGRFLSAVDFNLGGNGLPSSTGLYYSKVSLGSPPKEYYVQIDTGSDVLWVNCFDCNTCPKKSGLGMDLSLFDPKNSETASLVSCTDDFCKSTFDGQDACKQNESCPYSIVYGDGSTTNGFFVKDYITFNKVNGNLQTTSANSSVIFGCGTKQSLSQPADDTALDGLMGFGQSNVSVLSQLVAAKKVKNVFSHCLDTIKGGGIFAIGEVVAPKFNTTSLIPNMVHYNVLLKDMEVDGVLLDLPTDIFDSTSGREIVIDSGTTLAYLQSAVHAQLMKKIFDRQPELRLYTVEQQFTCFRYDGNVNDGFPVVKFHFEGTSLTVYPSEYLFKYQEDMWCIGWMKSVTKNKNGNEMILLGDLVLANKLVVYDIENMNIGWTSYNCSSAIKVKDETTGTAYTVVAHNLSSASSVLIGRILTFSLLLVAMLNSF